jgi:hypothetical protein
MTARAVLCVLVLLAAPSMAAAKDADAPVRVHWNSSPATTATWDARFSLLQGPGGFASNPPARPVIVLTDARTGERRRIATRVDVPPSTFRADVRFPHAGTWRVALARFDPRRPGRVSPLDAPVRVRSAIPNRSNPRGTHETLALAGLAALAAAVLALRRRLRRRRAGAPLTV